MRTRILVALLCLSTAIAFGVTGGPASAANSSKPVKGGTLTWGGICNNPKLDPAVAVANNSSCGAEMTAIYDVLLYEDVTDGYKIKYKLADSLTTKDNVSWVLKLKPGLKFTDTTALDAAAVKAVWDRHKDPATRSTQSAAVANVTALTVVDPTTLNITLASPQPSFPRTVSRNLSWIPSPTALAKHGTNYGTSPETVVGAGPYVLKQWLKDSQLAYDRNPNYYDAPKPYIDHIVYLVNGDATALLNSFKGGQAQGVIYGRADAAAEAKAAGATVAQIPATGVPEVQLMNVTIPPFNDIRVRQGFNMALDPKLLTTLLYDTGTIPKQHYLIPESSPWFNKKAAFPTFDAKKAQALFNDVAKETGKPIAIKHLEVTGDRMGEAHQTMMSTYQNVSVAPDKLTVTDYVTTIQQKKFEYARWTCPSASTSNIQADPDPALYDCFHSKSRINISGYSNPRVDTLLEQGRAATSFKDRKAAYDEVQEILAQDLPMLVQQVVIPGASFLLAKNLKGFELRLWGPDFSTMWLAKA